MRILLIIGCCILTASAFAETVIIDPGQDNTLYESSQGALSNGSGEFLFAGKTVNNGLRRALIGFKDLSAIPSGAVINSVKLHVFLSKEDSPETNVRLMRVLSDWGEGASDASGQEGQGASAMAGDATWNHRFFDNQTWASPGGDFSATPSAQTAVNDFGPYTIGSTEAMVADVQGWLENPDSNFGWILLANEEVKSARRFNSREHSNPERRPMLEVEYSTGSSGGSFAAPGSDFSGPWFDPASDGEGFLIFQTPVGWLIYYFGYSADNQRLWLVSNLIPIEQLEFGKSYEFSMLVGTPGSFSTPTPSDELIAWGTLLLVLSDCFTGIFTLDGTDGTKVYNAQKIVGVDGTACSVE